MLREKFRVRLRNSFGSVSENESERERALQRRHTALAEYQIRHRIAKMTLKVKCTNNSLFGVAWIWITVLGSVLKRQNIKLCVYIQGLPNEATLFLIWSCIHFKSSWNVQVIFLLLQYISCTQINCQSISLKCISDSLKRRIAGKECGKASRRLNAVENKFYNESVLTYSLRQVDGTMTILCQLENSPTSCSFCM